MSSKPALESHDDADERHDADSDQEYVFATIAYEYKTGGYPPAGFFCLWDDQLTFVHSKWVQFVTPVPLIGALLPDAVAPTGPEDTRTRTRIPYADIARATPYKKKSFFEANGTGLTTVHTRSGKDYHFGGGQINTAFLFEQVSAEIATALEAAGYTVSVTDDALTVQGHRTQDRPSDRSPVSDPLPPPVDIPADIAGRLQDDVAASQPPNRRQAPAWSALRAVSFGAAGAMLGAAAYGTVVILTQHEFVLASVALGAIVAFSVGLAGAALHRLWIGAISVVLTLLSLLLSEYVIARQFGGLTNAPLVLSPSETVTLIHDDLALNAAALWIWGVALLIACGAPARSRSRIETESAPDENAAEHRRAWRLISGRGAWLAAGTAFATGLVAVLVLAAVPLGPASQDQAPAAQRDDAGQVTKATNVTFQDVMVGDCYNNTPNSSSDALPEVPCLQPHDNEVFYIFTMSPGKYPGDNAIQTSADNTCGDRLSDYVGDSPSASLDYGSFVPDQLSWDSGERSVICDLTRSDSEKLNGTTRAPQ
jgi:Septum formation